MSQAVSKTETRPPPPAIPPLQNGDHLSGPEFERRWDATPGLQKAELIDGVVYMAPPVSFGWHSEPHVDVVGWLWHYRVYTPGVRSGADGSVRLSGDNTPQPDALLFIDPACGGQVRISDDDFLEGAPEFIFEVAATSAGNDLHGKFDLYRQNGVKEYAVWRTYDEEIDWFAARDGTFDRMSPGSDGVFRSAVFPGLWLDAPNLLMSKVAAVLAKLQEGIASAEHAAFVAQLAASRKS